MAFVIRLLIIVLPFTIAKSADAQWQVTRADFSNIAKYRSVMPLTAPGIDLLNYHQIKDVECMSWTIYFESRGSTLEDQIAVAWVTVNRSKSEKFHYDICTNIFAFNYINGKKLYQFDWVAYKPNSKMKIETGIWLSIQDIALAVYLQYFNDPTNGALYFKSVNAYDWAPAAKKTKIGSHVFW